MADLNISESLTYQMPDMVTDGKLNYVSFKPQGSTVYNPSETISIKLASNNQFMALERSYMKFTITTSAAGNLNPLGAISVFNSVQDTVSGLSLPLSRNYYIQRGVQLTTSALNRKGIQASCEAYTGTNVGVATVPGGIFTVCIPLVTSLDCQKNIPLALFNAGFQLFYTLNPAAAVVTAGTFTVSSVEIVAAMVTPDQSYLQEIANGLANGGTLKLPLQLFKSITSTLAPTSNQNIAINCGYLGSINNITLIEKTAALGPMKNATDIQNFYILCDGSRWPINKAITTGVEAFYQTLAAYNTSLISLTIPDASQSFQHYSFKTNQNFSSGISSANGLIEIAIDCTGSIPAAGSTIETIISYDALLIVSQNSCSLVVDV